MRINYDIIHNKNIDLNPYPHIICDNIFDEGFLNEIRKNWPRKNFSDDTVGNNLFLFSKEIKSLERKQKEFWTNFILNDVHKLSNILIKKFYNFIIVKSIKRQMDFGTGYAMENCNKSNPLDFIPHTHYFHDPLWVLTFLIYIEDEFDNSPGTSMYSIGETKDEKIKNFLKWNDIWHSNKKYLEKKHLMEKLDFKLQKVSDFRRNRLYCFYDGPFSFHSVQYKKSNKKVNRKALRFALGFSRKYIKEFYNIEPEKWFHLFKNNHNSIISDLLLIDLNLKKKVDFFSLFRKNLELSFYPIEQ